MWTSTPQSAQEMVNYSDMSASSHQIDVSSLESLTGLDCFKSIQVAS